MSAKKKSDDVVKPQVIDLDADAVTEINETPEAPPPPFEPAPPQPAPRTNSRTTLAIPLAALLVGALGGGWLYRDVLASYLPSDHMTALEKSVTSLQGDTASALKAAADKSQTDIAAFKSALDNATSQQATLENRIAGLESQSAKLADDIEQLKKRPLTTTTGANIDPAILTNLQEKIAALEGNIADLKKQGNTPNPVLAAFSTLRSTIDKGAAFNDQLAALTTAIPGLQIPDALTQSASTGTPTVMALAQELHQLASTLPTPASDDAAETTETGYWASFKKSLNNVISIKSEGPADWRTLASQASDLVDQGKLAEAIDLLSKAGEPPVPVANWLQKAATRISVDAALAALAPAVMQHATAP